MVGALAVPTLRVPAPVTVIFVVAVVAEVTPTCTSPPTVSVFPVPMTTEASPEALVLPACSPPIAWLKAPVSRVTVSAPVAALPRTTGALGEKVLSAEPVTLPATTRMLPELRLVVFVNVSVPRPALVTPSLLEELPR